MTQRSSFVITHLGKDVPSGIAGGTVEQSPAISPSTLKPGLVLVNVRAASVNFPDLLMTCGQYQHKPALPFVPGLEASGTVAAVGPGVEWPAVGDRVICAGGFVGQTGGFSTQAICAAASLVPLPPTFSYEQGASFLVAYGTSYHCLCERTTLTAGERVLVNGATGGVGFAAVQIAKAMGCVVVATGGDDGKLKRVQEHGGADHLINYTTTPRFRDAVKAATDGEGVDVVLDPVGGDVLDESLRCCKRWGARVLIVGFTSGRDPPARIPSNYALIKGLSVFGCRAGEAVRQAGPELAAKRRAALGRLAASGAIHPYVSHTLPLARTAEAMLKLWDRQVTSRICVTMDSADDHDDDDDDDDDRGGEKKSRL